MFAAWMLGLDNKSVALGLSHFVQAVQGRTERGFIASFRTGMIQTRDKSQPPIASRAALELYVSILQSCTSLSCNLFVTV